MAVAVDRREAHFLASKPRLLDSTQDINALAAEAFGLLERAHEAHWLDQPTRFLHSIAAAGEKVVFIGKIARSLSGDIESAPEVNPDQLALWVRSDGAVVHNGRTAA